MFSKISITGFRGITHLDIDDLQRINLFVGKNNCGKTSILEAVFLLIGAGDPESPLKINNLRGIKKNDEDFRRSIFEDFNSDAEVLLKADSVNPKENRHLQIKGAVKDSGSEFEISGDYQKKIQGAFINSEGLSENFTEGFDKLEHLKKTADIIKILRKIEPCAENILSGKDKKIYCDVGLERLIPVDMMGKGILRILSVIVAICNTQNGILLVDEIENGLHYSSHQILWDAVIEATKQFNVQIFAATHSIECIRALSDSIAGLNKHDDILRLFRIERKGKQFKAVKYNHHHIEASLSSDWEVR